LLDVGRDHVAGAVVGNSLYAVGGSDRFKNVATDRVQAYDVAAGAWVEKKPMPTARSGCTAVVVAGEIVVLGGEGSPGSGVVSPAVEAYDPVKDDWRTLPPMKTARHGLGPGLLDLYNAGGFDLAERELERYHAEGESADQVTLEPQELPHRLLSPIDIDADQIERGARLVVGFGLTFRSHRAETGRAARGT